MSLSNRMQSLEEGLKLIGLLTPESREKIIEAFIAQETQMVQQQTEINQLRNEITQLQNRMDKAQHHLSRAGSQN